MVISLDVDGVVNNYPYEMFRYASDMLKTEISSKDDLILELKLKNIDYDKFKLDYREKYECASKVSVEAKISEEFINFYNEIVKIRNLKLIFRTSRPVHLFPKILDNTKEWLNFNGINCHGVYEKSRQSYEFFNPIVHLDDEPSHLIEHLTYCDCSKLVLYDRKGDVKNHEDQFKSINSLIYFVDIVHELIRTSS